MSATSKTVTRILVTSIGLLLLVAVFAADQRWLDRHFLPSFFLPRRWYVSIHIAVRWMAAILGATLALGARSVAARLTAREVRRILEIAIAAMLALAASEMVLRRVHLRPAEWLLPDEEPRRVVDSRLGWTLMPARVGRSTVGGRPIEYAIDRSGYRVRRVEEPLDLKRPTIVFIGESMMFGEGLTWDESVPAQVEAMTGVQSANLAVHGYSTDQAYLHLQAELPRFRRPVAVISLFMTALFGRNLDDDRPHLGPGLVWMPAEQHARLVSLAGLLVPYRRDETVERGIHVTREVLQATAELARSRGATPLTAVPQFGEEEDIERTLRRRILDEAGMPYAFVEINAAWRLPWDRHPNPRAARTIAAAIVSRLQPR